LSNIEGRHANDDPTGRYRGPTSANDQEPLSPRTGLGGARSQALSGTSGANGALPVTAEDAQGELHRGDEFGGRTGSSIQFILRSGDDEQVWSFRLYEQAYQGVTNLIDRLRVAPALARPAREPDLDL
jgi:hypothetical protein